MKVMGVFGLFVSLIVIAREREASWLRTSTWGEIIYGLCVMIRPSAAKRRI
jgi:hypothetical protein